MRKRWYCVNLFGSFVSFSYRNIQYKHYVNYYNFSGSGKKLQLLCNIWHLSFFLIPLIMRYWGLTLCYFLNFLWEAKYVHCILILSVLWLQNSVDGPHYQSTSPADRPNIRPIPEHLHHQNGHHPGYHNGSDVRRSPPTHRSRSADPYYRDLSPPSHAITAPGAPPQTYVAKGVRANTMVSPLRATGPATQDTSK